MASGLMKERNEIAEMQSFSYFGHSGGQNQVSHLTTKSTK